MTDKPLKYLPYIKLALVVAAAAAVAVLVVGVYRTVSSTEVSIGSDKTIDITPQQIAEIKRLRHWEFLSVVDEQVVDTVRRNVLLPDDRLTCIYYGTLSLGIDLAYAPDDWVRVSGDTLTVTLPPPRLLDSRFIDESRTRVFYEHGHWGAGTKESMYLRAARRMRAAALTPANLEAVRGSAAERFTALFTALGAPVVQVEWTDR